MMQEQYNELRENYLNLQGLLFQFRNKLRICAENQIDEDTSTICTEAKGWLEEFDNHFDIKEERNGRIIF